MGGVQAKAAKPDRRRRPVLERKTSFAKKVVPIITSEPSDSSSEDLNHLMRSYQADCEDDKDLRDFDDKLRTGAEEVARHRTTGFDRLNKCLKYLTQSNEKIVSEISACTQKILEAKGEEAGMVMTANEKLLDHLMTEYVGNSWQTLQLCEKELQDFIKSAHDVHSCIADVVRDGEVSKKLNESIMKYHHSAKAVVAKVNYLQDQHADMLNKLKEQILKFDKKVELARTLKKVVNVVFIGMLSALFVCTIMAAAMAAPPVASALTTHPCIAGVVAGGAVVYACSPVFKEGRHWLLNLIQDYESTLEAQKGLIKSMEAGTGEAIKELDGIMSLVEKVIAKGNDQVLSKLNSANDEGRVDLRIEDPEVIIMGKLADFDQEIKELDKRREECLKITGKARDQVLMEYGELKRSEVWNTKTKM
ncbi:PREDICTED: UPF0496 protein At4g34320-like [Fragaria vesca subsp. vesca]|uniref:UPF0496 protein At4g34320-like n=1 Tax=Fragaria vesca subsp. vesca TaxID=101020 RepID=UPI0002C2FC14|nr:PREDICTED: UPF0496 protein At4g34320-like [Fragaria vesca subsp. vesca]